MKTSGYPLLVEPVSLVIHNYPPVPVSSRAKPVRHPNSDAKSVLFAYIDAQNVFLDDIWMPKVYFLLV